MTVAMPLRFTHPAASQLSGSGMTLNTSLTRAHAVGAPVASKPSDARNSQPILIEIAVPDGWRLENATDSVQMQTR